MGRVQDRVGRRICLVAIVAAALTISSVPGISAAPAAVPPTAPLLRIPFPQDDGSLTPYTFELGYALMSLVYDTLLWRDAEGQPQPWLARSVLTSPDGRQVTVRLADGARWHDGTPVTADDVAFTFDYVAKRFHPRFTPALRNVDRVQVFDPSTLVIVLRQPSPGFADQPLADMPILPAHLWRDLPADRPAPEGLAIGSGPYRLTEYRSGQGWRFEANPDYFRGAPAVAAIDVPVIRDLNETLEAFRQRRVDMVAASLPATALEGVTGFGTSVARGPSYLGTVLMFNLRRAPFDRVEARRAVAGALDPARLARAVGGAVAADRGYLHPASPWALDATAPGASSPGSSEAPAPSAVQVPVRILAPDNDPVKLDAGRQVVRTLTRAGMTAELITVSREELERAVGEDGSPPSFEAAIWSAPPLASYDPAFLTRLFGSDPLDARFNLSGYTNAAFDEAATRVQAAADPGARRAAVGDLLKVLAEDAPAVSLFYSDGAFAYRPAIYDGWVYVKGTGILDKRSFVEPRRDNETAAGADGTDRESSGSGDSRFPLGWTAVGVLVVAGLLGAAQFRRKGPEGPMR